MRYCPNEPSIWADEQGERARKETVAFRDGKLLYLRINQIYVYLWICIQ